MSERDRTPGTDEEPGRYDDAQGPDGARTEPRTEAPGEYTDVDEDGER